MKKTTILKLSMVAMLVFGQSSFIERSFAQVADEGWVRVSAPAVSPDEAKAYYASKSAPIVTASSSTSASTVKTSFNLSSSLSEIVDLANALNHDPKLIYDFVHNNIDYVPYFGMLKSVTETLLDKSGNDFDQAALMIALLRESGYAASFQNSLMAMPRVGLANWLGVDATFTRISSVLSYGGIPNGAADTVNNALLVSRVYVKATVGGADYFFDPAYKQYDYKAKIDLSAATGYNRTDLINSVNNGASITADYAQNLNEGGLRISLAMYANNLIAKIRAVYSNADIREIIGGRSVQRTQITSLITPISPVVSSVNEWQDVPSQYYTTVRIQHLGLDKIFLTTDLSGKRLTVTYAGSDNHPELRLDGIFVASGSASVSGTKNDMTLKVDHQRA